VAPTPATLDCGNRTVVNFQRVPRYPFKINTGTRAAVYHISDTPACQPTVGVFVCLLSAAEEQDDRANAANNEVTTSFESINYCTVVACISLYWESKLTPVPLPSSKWGLLPGMMWVTYGSIKQCPRGSGRCTFSW